MVVRERGLLAMVRPLAKNRAENFEADDVSEVSDGTRSV